MFASWRSEPPERGELVPVNAKTLVREEQRLLALLVAMLTLVTFFLLFTFRFLDDNRLTSWQWVFADADVVRFSSILLGGLLLAYAMSHMSFVTRRPVILLFTSSFAVAMLFWGEPEVNVDAARYFIQAKHLELYGAGYFLSEWGNQIMVWTDLPLIPFLYGLIFGLVGETRIGTQVFSSLLFSGTVVLTFLIGKTLWNREAGLYAGGLLLGMPYLLTQVPLMLVDVPAMFFVVLAVFTTIKAARNGGIAWLLGASLAITLAMLSKYSAWLILSVIPIIFLCHADLGWRVVGRRGVAVCGCATFVLAIFLLWKFEVIASQISLLQSYQLPGLQRWQESLTSTFFFQIHPFITFAALCSVYVAIRKKDWKYVIIGWPLLLVILLDIRRARYMVVVLPMVALLAAYALREIKNAGLARSIVSCSVAFSLAMAVFGYLPFLQKTSAANVQAAGKYLNTIEATEVEVYALAQLRSLINPAVTVPLLDMFTDKLIVAGQDSPSGLRSASIDTSSLRFTWDGIDPDVFTKGATYRPVEAAVVIISSDRRQVLPDPIAKRTAGYRLSKEFMVSDRVFNYQTIIRIYEPASSV
ncbi:MAG: glycosyltransferase family 39 protein [Gammaproteobacteria bacterium]